MTTKNYRFINRLESIISETLNATDVTINDISETLKAFFECEIKGQSCCGTVQIESSLVEILDRDVLSVSIQVEREVNPNEWVSDEDTYYFDIDLKDFIF